MKMDINIEANPKIFRHSARRSLLSAAPYAVALLCAALLLGCTDASDGTHRTDTGFPEDSDLHVAQTELWGIGDQWYTYDVSDHSIAPKPISWVVTRGKNAYFFRILRYYGDDGASGKPTLRVRAWDGEAFGSEHTIGITRSIHDAPACVSFERMAVVSCDDKEDFDLVWRTDRRPIAEELFAVNNPALYVAGDADTWVAQYANTSPPDQLPSLENTVLRELCDTDDGFARTLEPPETCETLPWRIASIFDNDAQPHITQDVLETNDVTQITATMHVAQWRADVDPDGKEITLWARCVDVNYSAACTPLLQDEPASTTLSIQDLSRWTFIDLCGPQGTPSPYEPTVTASKPTLAAGTWPSNERFDLAVERQDEELRLWMAPSHPFAIVDHDGFAPQAAPSTLWSIPGETTCD